MSRWAQKPVRAKNLTLESKRLHKNQRNVRKSNFRHLKTAQSTLRTRTRAWGGETQQTYLIVNLFNINCAFKRSF